MKPVLGIALASVAVMSLAAQTQAPPRDRPRLAISGSAGISGIVVADDETRAPLRNVRVSLERSGIEDIRSTSTDDQGRYRFENLPAGTYALNMIKAPYVRMEYGAPKPGMPGRTVVLDEGQSFAAAPVAMVRGAVIAGRLSDRHGRPAVGTEVNATQFVVRDGRREARLTAGASGTSATNAHGDYRIYGLLPGVYVVYATTIGANVRRETSTAEMNWVRQPAGPPPASGRAFVYSPTWFPGTPSPQGAPVINLAKGEERAGIDFALTASPASRLSGVVTDEGGAPAVAASVRLVPREQIAFFASIAVVATQTAADGTFAFNNVPMGDYGVLARGAARTLWGMTTANAAGQDVRDLAIRLQPGLSVSGVLEVTGAAAPDWDLKAVQVSMAPSGGALDRVIPFFGVAQSPIGADGTFKIDGIVPGPYRVQVSLPSSAGGWYVRSAMAGGRDAIDVPIEIGSNAGIPGLAVSITNALGELSGTITDADKRPVELYVFAFSQDRADWRAPSRRIAFVRSTEKGAYAMKGLPPGEYYLCALTELDLQMRYEPEYLELLVPAAVKIALGEAEKKRQDLQVGGAQR